MVKDTIVMKLFQDPINCYNHPTRYRTLIILHIIETITFIIRFILVCVDLSQAKEKPTSVVYPIFIFLLELIGTLPFFVSNILFVVSICFKTILCQNEQPICCTHRAVLRVARLTCFPCQCYRDHPQGIQLTRVIILIICFIIRFIAFILGASCAATYNPICVPYAVISSLALVPSFLTFLIEWLHFHVLWNFQPVGSEERNNHHDRSHLRFISEKLVNEKRIRGYDSSLCKEDTECGSTSLNHTILYHSIRKIRVKKESSIRIMYHATTVKKAIEIARNGFLLDRNRQLINEIYFTPVVEQKKKPDGIDCPTLICARLNLGHIKSVENDEQLDFSKYNDEPELPQTLESVKSGKIKVRFPGQIENWVIRLPTENDGEFDPSYYDGCI